MVMAEVLSEASSRPPVAIAPAVDSVAGTSTTNSPAETRPYTCTVCAKRKVKCDKIYPTCTTCRKAHLDCEYQEPAPRKRKRKPEDELHARLEHYERLLKEHGILEKTEKAKTNPATQSFSSPFYTIKSVHLGEKEGGKLHEEDGKSRYIDSGMWRNLGEQDMHPSSDEEEDEPNYPASQQQFTPVGDPASAALLGSGLSISSLISFHPSYDSATKLWKLYSENVDPIVKVTHGPSFETTFKRIAANPGLTSRSLEALIFAVYHIAIVSSSEKECMKLFGESQSILQARYYDAARQALVNANFLRTTDLAVIQAYILFLLAVRTEYDPHTFWMLTGIAIRIAQRMGLHRDGEEHGLKPFDVQMRRRIFWQLIPLDGLAGQMCGTGICLNPEAWDVKQPLNVNDTDIWPDMAEPPASRVGATDIMFLQARSELSTFVQKDMPFFANWTHQFSRSELDRKEARLKELEEMLEVKFLRYCDFADPLHNIVMAMCRTAVSSGRLRTLLPNLKQRQDLSDEERQDIWTQAMKVLDRDLAVSRNGNLARFRWHLQSFFQWDGFIWILNEIRRDPSAHKEDDVWDVIEAVYTLRPYMMTQRRALHIAVGRLTVEAWEISHPTTDQAFPIPRPEPDFITGLRSFVSKKTAGQAQNGFTPPSYAPNGVNPPQASMDTVGGTNLIDMNWDTNNFDLNGFAATGAEAMDWMFWDQLIRDPGAFPTT